MTKITFNEIPAALEDIVAEISSIKILLMKTVSPKHTEPPPEVLNFEQAVDFLNRHGMFIKKSSLYKRTCSGQIAYRKIAGRLVFDRTELMEWVNTLSQDQAKINTNQVVVKSAIKKK